MVNKVNQWLLKRVVYLLSLYFVLCSNTQGGQLTTVFYELNNFIAQFELPFSLSIFLTTAQLSLIVMISALIVAVGVYVGFKGTIRAGTNLGRRISRLKAGNR